MTANKVGNPVWIDSDSNEEKPIDKFKVDKPDEEFKDDLDDLASSEQSIVKSQIKDINNGYAAEDSPVHSRDNTEYLSKFQTSESGLPYSKRVGASPNRFTYAIHRPKKEGGKMVSHVEPVNCKGHKWRGKSYAHDRSGRNEHRMEGKNLEILKTLRDKKKQEGKS